MNYRTYQDVDADIHAAVPDFPARPDRMPRRMRPLDLRCPSRKSQSSCGEGTNGTNARRFLLVAEPAGYRHRGIDISSKVGGLGELAPGRGIPDEPGGHRLPRSEGRRSDHSIASTTERRASRVRPDRTANARRGVIYYTRPVVFGGLGHRRALWPLYRLAENPVWVSVSGTTAGKT